MDAIDFIDLFVFVGVKILDQTEKYLEVVTHPSFQVSKELLLTVIELILAVESTKENNFGGDKRCFRNCIDDISDGYSSCSDSVATVCLNQCDLTESQCKLWNAYSTMWISSVVIRMVVLAIMFFPFLALTFLRTKHNQNDSCMQFFNKSPKMRNSFHWFLNIWAVVFGLLSIAAVIIALYSGDTSASLFMFLVLQLVDTILTFGSIGYSLHKLKRVPDPPKPMQKI